MLGDSIRRRHDRPEAEEGDRPPRRRPSGRSVPVWAAWLGIGLVVLLGSFGVGFLISTRMLFPRPETAGAGIAVPALYGEDRAAAESALREAGLTVGEVTELPSEEVGRDRVMAQSPVPGQELRRGGVVSFAVSSGPPTLRVPPVRGLGRGTARELLESVGFEVDVQEVRQPGARAGAVVGTDPPVGTVRNLPSRITVRVAPGGMADTAVAGPRDTTPAGPGAGGTR